MTTIARIVLFLASVTIAIITGIVALLILLAGFNLGSVLFAIIVLWMGLSLAWALRGGQIHRRDMRHAIAAWVVGALLLVCVMPFLLTMGIGRFTLPTLSPIVIAGQPSGPTMIPPFVDNSGKVAQVCQGYVEAANSATYYNIAVGTYSGTLVDSNGNKWRVFCKAPGVIDQPEKLDFQGQPASAPSNPQGNTSNTQGNGPTPVAPAASSSGSSCHDNSTTSLGERDPLIVDGTETNLEVRDLGCIRDLFHTETGVGKGKNFDLNIPKGWSLGVAAVSCEVVQDGGSPVDYKEGPFLVIRGPWSGKIGCYEAGLHGVPSEWESFLLNTILPIHRDEVGNQDLQPIFLGGQ